MRLVICYISLLATGFALVGCGQSGALQLPSDPDYDKRAKYLLYPNVDSKQQSEQKEAAPVQQELPASSAETD
ncbi:LPS translocon maturation chaperone LptM [Acinetobacter sp.]|uniref:LPS translocon maturation chaperone LptM n=1 Tax=Acinetobacter sp. TaxID=472 RepID=UPI003890D830